MKMASKKAKWTVMVYMAGDNNLDLAALRDISEMARVGSSKEVSILVQLDRGIDFLTRRFYITEGGGYQKDVVESFEETNSGDPKILEDFILWTVERYPANHYLLILWNHGGGWWEEESEKSKVKSKRLRRSGALFKRYLPFTLDHSPFANSRSIAFDDTSRDFLDNKELKGVLSRISGKFGKKIDILGMDACLMQMIEVAYELKDIV